MKRFAFALLVFLLAAPDVSAVSATAGRVPVRVVVDRNYAPYSFQSPGGTPQGFLVEQWRAWEQKTGIPVEITALDWDKAQREMLAGRFDVIESIVQTPQRNRLYDFLPPYSTAQASIYFRKDIAGIKDLESLRGFPVGVQAGDQHAETLLRSGITDLVKFQSNEDIIAAAMRKQINVFVLDDPSAHFLLNRLGVTSEFRQSPPVFRDALRRAVRKGDAETFRTVTAGFRAVGPTELERIQEKWVGKPIAANHPYLDYAIYVFAAAGVLFTILLLWNRTLSRGILRQTAALAESEQRFRQIATSIREVFWMSTPAMDELLYVSPAYAEVWGRPLDSARAVPASFLEAIHEEDLEGTRAAIAASRGCEFEVTYRIIRPDGSIRWIRDRGFPVRDESGRIYRVAGIAEDITEHKLVNDALRQSEFDLAEAQRLAKIGSWSLDFRTGALRWSEQLFCLFDVDKADAADLYQTARRRVHPEDAERLDTVTEEVKASGEPFEIEHRLVTRAGLEKYVRAVGHAWKSAGGEVTGLFGSVQDITDQKLTENALRRSGEQLQSLSRRLVELRELERREMARELHDQVGQNLTALDINLSILAGSLPPDASEIARARLADSGALIESTTAAIRNMLAELRPPMLDEQGLGAALDWHAREFSARVGIPVAISGMDAFERPVPAVELALFRISQEALNNIAKHARASRVEIALQRSVSAYELSVSDDGVGFDEAGESGSGRRLGLVTMRERAQSLGGWIEVHSSTGEGTRLTVGIPA
jgi:PAS domain S-box-containing protein